MNKATPKLTRSSRELMYLFQQTPGQWQKVFWIFIPVYIVTEIFFLVFSSGTVQTWNYGEAGERRENADESELDKLKEQDVKTSVN